MQDLAAITVDINSIHQDSNNARLHSTEQLEYIAASLKRFGQQKPVVVGEGNIIIAGNGTHAAAKLLGWSSISIVKSNLPRKEARAYAVADNQLATQSEWDLDSLSKHLKDLSEWNPMQDWKAIGFDKAIIEPVIEQSYEENNALQNFLGGTTSETAVMGKSIKLTAEQREIVDEAIRIIKLQVADYRMSEGRALELLAADFLSGAQIDDGEPESTANDIPF